MFSRFLFGNKRTSCGSQQQCEAAAVRALAMVEPLENRAMFSVVAPAATLAETSALQTRAITIAHPHVTSVKPVNGATKVSTNPFVSAELAIPNGGVNAATLTSANVYLVRKSSGTRVSAMVNTSGGGDVIVLKPNAPLSLGATYSFVITSGVKDVTGVSFTPFQSSFTVGSTVARDLPDVQFKQLPQGSSAGRLYFGMTMGPDGKLYAGTDKGELVRFPIAADGSLGSPTTIRTIFNANGGPRFVVGLAFDPASTAENPILWVTHSAVSALELGGFAGADWTGKVSRLSGKDLSIYHDAVVHLPRSVRDHVTDQCAFGPDGSLYFCQPSESSMGRADVIWGNRAEHLLSAAILRLNLEKLGNATLDARTPDGGGQYNPFAANAPLTIYARGVRNAFDLVWDSNGQLYAPGNGSAAGGNTPAGDGAPALTNVRHSETDYLFRIQEGGYYGHPNPLLGYYVLNGGNPTSGKDPYEVVDYPAGTQPDPNWKPAAFNMGEHESPDGAIEYHGNAFGGALNGKLLICRYSGGDDIVAIGLNASGSVSRQYANMSGMTGLQDPVDLVEDPRSGFLYVSELGAKRITLLRPAGSAAPFSAIQVDQVSTPVDDTVTEPAVEQSPEPAPATSGPVLAATSSPAPALPLNPADQRLVRKIERLCQRSGSTTPDLTALQHRELKEVLRFLRKAIASARKLHQPVPDFAGLTDRLFSDQIPKA